MWWEAENPSAGSFPKDNPHAPQNAEEAAKLSAGVWIGVGKTAENLDLEYVIDTPIAGDYTFYARKFWRHGPFRFRFDDAPWTEVKREATLLDRFALREDVQANWVEAGNVHLAAGPHRVRLELTAGGPAGFDAFVLVAGPFIPRGTLRPDVPYPPAPSGWFNFDAAASRPPGADGASPLPPKSLDLRDLNETRAGEHGLLAARDGRIVRTSDGAPMVFWGTNAGHDVLTLSTAKMQQYARWQATLGVNLVRLHGQIWRFDDIEHLDETKLADIHRLVDALREQGIYLALSIYFPRWLTLGPDSGFAGYDGQYPFGLAYYDPRMRAIQKRWWHDLLTTPNPATNLPLAEDPAVAFVELVNEDSTLFFTFETGKALPDAQAEVVAQSFTAWLVEKYGSVTAATEHWQERPRRGDDLAKPHMTVMPPSELARNHGPRAQDTAEFLTRLMLDDYMDLARYIKQDLGFRNLLVCSNWRTANPRVLGPLDKWANSRPCDIMDHHGYYAGPHVGEAANYDTRKGDMFDDRTALRFETKERTNRRRSFTLPFVDVHYDGKPSIISEIGWSWPNRYRTELPLLAATYGALQGTDGIMFFATSDPQWAHQLRKFGIADPNVMGQFPASALLFRRGLVRTAPPSATIQLSDPDLFGLKGIPYDDGPNLDALRQADAPDTPSKDAPSPGDSTIDALAPYVGPVEVVLGGALSASVVAEPLERHIDHGNQIVTSSTDEVAWNWSRGLVTVSAPAVQAAIGFLDTAPIELRGAVLDLAIPYGAVALVALDDRPIDTSHRILLQVASETQNTGWSAPGSGPRAIVEVGGPPILVRELEGTIELRRGDAKTMEVWALDLHGTPKRRANGGADFIALLPDTLFYLIVTPDDAGSKTALDPEPTSPPDP